jgi:stage IV sporulation protein B
VAVRRGEKGNPGELTGLIEYTPEQVSGVIESNTSKGIYGVANQELLSEYTKLESIPIASKQEVKTGQALLLCKIEEEAKYYEMEITKISTSSTTAINRRLSIRITDEELLALTGGIVQGMSGAPIIQNGKFVGAVTHVLVQDSSKGYGIFIEDMLPNG